MSGFVNPLGWDPHTGANLPDIHAISPLLNQVVEYNPINPSEIIGDLAKSWIVSDDGVTYIFNLNEGIKWWDGRDLTADDVAFSIERIVEPGAVRPRAGRLRTYVDTVEKIDQHTVQVDLLFPSGAFLALLAVDYMKVVPQHVVEAGVDINIFENFVGSGPFKAVEFTSGVSYKFEKNPDYFKEGRPFFDGIEAFIITEKGAEIAAFKTERVLMNISGANHLDVDDVVALEEDDAFMSKFDLWPMEGVAGHHFLLNVDQAPFDDERVRRAVFLALDRQELQDGFGLGKWRIGAPMTALNPFALPEDELLQLPGYRQLDGKKHPDDLAEAKQLMIDAGYENGVKITMHAPIVEYLPDAAQVGKEQLKEALGIDMEIVIQDVASQVNIMAAGDFQMATFGYGPMVNDPDDRFQALYLKGSRNWTNWSDPKVDELFALQQKEIDPEKRKEYALEMQRIVVNGAPGTIEFIWKPFFTIVSKRINTEAGHFVQALTVQTRFKHEHEWLEPE
jgi:peptide/nickel transport system substrate-binding protein